MFKPRQGASKAYDLVMVANWARHKRHAVLFRALEQIHDREIRVLLIGFPLGGRTAADIRREATTIRNPRVTVEVIDSVPAAQVADYVSRCKAFVFLSRKEGDNKALVEAMFADVPAIVFADTVGGAGSRINPATGIFARDVDLPRTIVDVLDHADRFAPRAWALAHTGSGIATRILNEAIRNAVVSTGGRYTTGIVEKTNSPNLAYGRGVTRTTFEADYQFILSCRRGLPPQARRAVA